MSYRLKVKILVPEVILDDPTATESMTALHTGFYHDAMYVTAAWDDEAKKCVGWVVPAGAEKYAREHLDPMKLQWEVVEYE